MGTENNSLDDIDWEDLLEEEDEQEEEDEEDEDEDEDDDDGGERTFTQVEVNRIMSKEKKAGRRSGIRKVLEELGVESIAEAKEKLGQTSNNRGTNDNGGNEQDPEAAEQARKAKEAADREKAEAARLKLEAKVERRLVRAKVDDKKIERALRMIDLDDLDDGDDDEIDVAIEDLREDLPELFTESKSKDDDDEDKGKPRAPGSNPGGVPRKKGTATPQDKAMARLQKRHGAKLSNTKS